MARPDIGEAEIRAVEAVLRSGNLAQGAEVAAFETEFSHVAVADAQCIAVNSGTSALHLALLAAGIGPGDEVLVPSFTFAATANAVVMAGAVPRFCDIEMDSYCIDPDAVASMVGPKTAGVIPVHLYGHPADMTTLKSIADRESLFLLEDASQAHLASLNEEPVGTLGDAATFSFYPTKNMTTGEGGMIVTRDETLEQRSRLLRNQGQQVRYMNEIAGLNNRMTEMSAAIGRVQLTNLRSWTLRRQAIAEQYKKELRGVIVPSRPSNVSHVYHQFTIRVPGHDRDRFARELQDRNVQTGVYYPKPVHALPAYGVDVDLPNTLRASQECLSIPIRPSLTDAEVHSIIHAVNDVAGAGS